MKDQNLKDLAEQLHVLVRQLSAADRYDLLLDAIGVPVLEQLQVEAAKADLSPLVITKDYSFFLPAYGNAEVQLSPVHKAVYLLFLAHPEGIEFKRLSDYREEMLHWYHLTGNRLDEKLVEDTVSRLVNPLDNAINEKCSRIKAAFSRLMDPYKASYYIISSHVQQPVSTSGRVWFRRLKLITMPRRLVVFEGRTE